MIKRSKWLYFQFIDIQNFVCLILILSFIVPTLSHFIFTYYKKIQLKNTVKSLILVGINKRDLVVLKFTLQEKQNLHFEHPREFEYKREMYDVVYEEVKGDTVTYWCWHDYQETQLNQKLCEIIITINNQFNTHDFFKLFKKIYFYCSLLKFHFFVNYQLYLITLKDKFIDSFYFIDLTYPPEQL